MLFYFGILMHYGEYFELYEMSHASVKRNAGTHGLCVQLLTEIIFPLPPFPYTSAMARLLCVR